MIKRISNYEELTREKEELELQLQLYKDKIRLDVKEIKEELQPATHAMTFIGKMLKKDHSNPIMTGGANMLIDLIVKKVILSRASWITRLVVPFILKNYSSHILAEKKVGLWHKLRAWIRHGGKNGDPDYNTPDVDIASGEKAN